MANDSAGAPQQACEDDGEQGIGCALCAYKPLLMQDFRISRRMNA
jgi:hypothetical protein